jgi:hypothetical protein
MIRTRNAATPQDTQDHMLGSGALTFSWWAGCTTVNADTPEWAATLTCEDGDGGTKTAVINHEVVLTTARFVMANVGKTLSTPRGGEYPAWSRSLERQCWNLLTEPGEADLDACVADELLQLAVLGEVVFG